MDDTASTATTSPDDTPTSLDRFGTPLIGGVLGGLAGAAFAVLVTDVIKRTLDVVSRQDLWVLVVVPLVGITVAVLVLHGLGHGEAVQPAPATETRRIRLLPWRVFPLDVARADLTGDVVANAGAEERFPWRLAPLRAIAIVSTVGLGAPMGTEAPAAHLGVAAGAWLGDRGAWFRRIARPAALAGGAAGVSALMGLPLVGAVFMLELGRRRQVAISVERVLAALAGGLVGWGFNEVLDLAFIRLVVPQVPPEDLLDALLTAAVVGVVAGAITSLTGAAIYRARGWGAPTATKLVVGALGVGCAVIALANIASQGAAVGPGGGAIVWAETTETAALTLLAVALLRAAATTAAVVAGGCGGVFVPFLAIGDIAGRAFAPSLGVSGDLAGAAGAAGGIAGGYRLPWTAAVMVIGVGGPYQARLTCLATVGIAAVAGVGAGLVLDRLTSLRPAATARRA